VRQSAAAGRIRAVGRRVESPQSRGWFETDAPLTDPDALAGRTLVVRHGDGTSRAWTVARVENTLDFARLFVREEPGFALMPATGVAHYYQFPQTTAPGPHLFRIGRVARSGPGPGAG
jgi:hypothetical protein